MATMTTSLSPLQLRGRPTSATAPTRQQAAQLALAELFPDVKAAADAALADLFPALRLRSRPAQSADAWRR